LLISHRAIDPIVWRCMQVECEDVIGQIDDADIVAPLPRVRGEGGAMQFVQRALRRSMGISIAFDARPEPTPIERDYDLLCFFATSPRDVAFLKHFPGWRQRCAQAICWVDELWIPEVELPRMVNPLRQFDRVLLALHGTVAPLQRKIGVPCNWMPPAVDTLRFCPWPDPPPRHVDVHAMGRRAAETHGAIQEYAACHRWTYVYDTLRPRHVYNVREHREQLAEMVKHSRFFTANRAKVDVPSQTGGQKELALRFFEGAAGGAIMIGEPATPERMATCFDWPDAVVPLPYGSKGIGAIFDELERDPARVHRARCENVRQSLRRHDWAHRWQQVLKIAGLEPRPALGQRIAKLAALADQVR
jgi:hypothetical protein